MRLPVRTHLASVVALPLVLVLYASAGAAPNLQLIAEIPIPNWVVTANPTPPPPLNTNASFDLLSFDPVRQIMYSADRPNRGVDVIDTKTNTLLGIIPVPLQSGGTSNPSGVQVAPDLKELIVTDRGTGAAGGGVYIYDLTASPTPECASQEYPGSQRQSYRRVELRSHQQARLCQQYHQYRRSRRPVFHDRD